MAQPTTTTPANTAADASTKNPVVCVFCGASPGTSPAHLAAARSLATHLARTSSTLIYGGGTVGLMGEIARTLVAQSAPARVHGIIPTALIQYEQARTSTPTIDANLYGCTTTVPDMHTRKKMMADEVRRGGPGSGFVALSGGYGTLEEIMEVTTWNQLGIHGLPVVLYNVDGYWDGLVQWMAKAVESGFVAKNNAGIVRVAESAEEVMQILRNYETAEGRFDLKWDEQ